MIKLYNSNITDILPEALSGKNEVIALGYAINKAMQRLIEYCRNTSVYAVIDTAPDYVLDMLALELNTQYYDDSLEIEAKRKLIKNTLVWYMSAGTPAAVEELIAAVFGEGEVKEWFEYGGEPYFFKILTNALMTPEMNEQFTTMLRRVKNARSHIEAIEIHRTIEQPYTAGVGQHSNYKPAAVIDGYDVSRDTEGTVYAGVLNFGQTRPEPILDGFDIVGERVEGYTYSGAAMAATAKQAAIREALSDTADTVTTTVYTAAEGYSVQKPAAIMEGLTVDAEPVTQAITAGVAADSSIYKNTITE